MYMSGGVIWAEPRSAWARLDKIGSDRLELIFEFDFELEQIITLKKKNRADPNFY